MYIFQDLENCLICNLHIGINVCNCALVDVEARKKVKKGIRNLTIDKRKERKQNEKHEG